MLLIDMWMETGCIGMGESIIYYATKGIKMPNARTLDIQTEAIKCMIIGKNGSGKSIFASSFPTPGFVFDFDKGIISYRGNDFDYENFDLSAKGWSKFVKVFDEVDKSGEYKTIIIDSTTAMTACAMQMAMQLDPTRSPTGGPVWNKHYGMVKNLVEGYIHRCLNFNDDINFITGFKYRWSIDQDSTTFNTDDSGLNFSDISNFNYDEENGERYDIGFVYDMGISTTLSTDAEIDAASIMTYDLEVVWVHWLQMM